MYFLTKKSMIASLSVISAVLLLSFLYYKFKTSKIVKISETNIVLIGAAGSGKGTQGDLLKKEFNLMQVSAGEVLRQARKNPREKYSKTITEYIDKGQLVPTKITNELLQKHIDKNVFCKECTYKGVIFDGFPREIKQLEFLDKYLKSRNNKIDAVIYINVPMDTLVDRLSGRYSCAKCGELYHKIAKPTKVAGVCDKCGHKHFVVRDDDKNTDAIRERFKIFEEKTKVVLDIYEKRGIVIKVDGTKTPQEVYADIKEKLTSIVIKK